MKKKSLTMLLTGLLAVSLTGVGFASWIIVQGDEQYADGSVHVEEIENHAVTIDAKWADNDGDTIWLGGTDPNNVVDPDDSQLSFGTTNKAEAGWLRNTNGTVERKSLTLNYTISNFSYATSVTAVLEVTGNKAGYEDAVDAKYITGVSVGSNLVDTTDFKSDAVTLTASGTLTVSFDWGDTFGNENPYDYYNDATTEPLTEKVPTTDITYASHAETNIGNMYTYLSGVTFKLTLTANVD